MIPWTDHSIIGHIKDDFDGGVHPCYWAARLTDSTHPPTPGEGFYNTGAFAGYVSQYQLTKARKIFTTAAGKLEFPTFVWTPGSTPFTQCWYLMPKYRKLLPPFTFDVAFKITDWDVLSGGNPNQRRFQCYMQMLGHLDVQYDLATTSNRWVYTCNNNTFTGQCIFANGSANVGDEVQFQMRIEADLMATYQFKVNGVTPSHIAGQSFPPDTAKHTDTGPSSNLWSDVLEDFRDEFLTVGIRPVDGGKLGYFELKIHDHTA